MYTASTSGSAHTSSAEEQVLPENSCLNCRSASARGQAAATRRTRASAANVGAIRLNARPRPSTPMPIVFTAPWEYAALHSQLPSNRGREQLILLGALSISPGGRHVDE